MAKKRNLLLTISLAAVCLIALLCAALLPMTTARAAEYEYVLSTESKIAAADSALIVHQSGGKYFAMTATSSSGALTVTEVTLKDNNTAIDTSATTVNEKMLWKIKSAGGSDVEIESLAFTSYNKLYAYSSVSLSGSSSTLDGSSGYLCATNYKYVVGSSTGYTMDAMDSTKFLIFVQQEAQSGTEMRYTKSSLTAGTKTGILVGVSGSTSYAMGTFSASSTSLNKAWSVTIDGKYLNLGSNTENWLVWEVTISSSNEISLKMVGGNGISATGKYFKMNNNGTTSNSATEVKLTYEPIEGSDSFYLKDTEYLYCDGSSNFKGKAAKDEAKGPLTFYELKEYVPAAASTVTFKKGNESAVGDMAAQTVEQGEYTLPQCGFTLADHKFAGWLVGEDTEAKAAGTKVTISGDTTITAKWESTVCTLTFKAGDDTYDPVKATIGSNYNFGNSALMEWVAARTPQGKLFSCWTDGKTEWKSFMAPAGDMTLNAVFVDAATISFDWNGGNAPQSTSKFKTEVKAVNSSYSLTLYSGESYLNQMPTREGYVFKGWSVKDTETKYLIDTNDVDYPQYAQTKSVTITKDTTFVAIWGKEQYTITFVVDGSNTTKTVKDGESFTINGLRGTTSNPTKQGFLFDGWLGSDNAKIDGTTTITPEDDMTFTASFREPAIYTVTFHFGDFTATKEYTEGAFASIPLSLFNELFADQIGEKDIECTGWYEESEFKTLFSVSGFTVSSKLENLDLYAKVNEKYTVTLNWGLINPTDTDDKITTISRAAGTAIDLPYPSNSSVTKEKYTLVGWSETKGGAIKYKAEAGVKVTSACTLYAVWDYNYYVITIKVFGESETTRTVEVAKVRASGSSTRIQIGALKDENEVKVVDWNIINLPHKDATWTLVTEEGRRDYSITEDITLTADINLEVKFTDHIYKITLTNLGGDNIVITGKFGDAVTAPAIERAGYEFIGFKLSGRDYTFTTMPGEDIEVYCVFEALDSTLTFDTGNGGTEIASITQKSGSMVNKPADPVRDGYTFVNWQLGGKDVTWLVKDGTSLNPEYYINMPGGGGTLVAKWELTAEGLIALKTAKLAELEAYADKNGVEVPANGIENATTEAGVLEAYQTAIAKVDELKAEKDAQAKALADAKTAAKTEAAVMAAAAGVKTPSTEAIDKAGTIEQVNTAKIAVFATITKVASVQSKINTLSGKKGAELFTAIAEATEAKDALGADEKSLLDMTGLTAAKEAYNAYVTAANSDLNVAADIAMSVAAVKVATAVTAIAALAFVLKRRAW